MKKLIISIIAMCIMAPSFAQHHRHYGHRPIHHHRHWHPHYGWVVPAIIGGAVVYSVTRPDPVIVQQPPVIVQDPQQQNCSPWTETQNSDGTITRTRTCAQ